MKPCGRISRPLRTVRLRIASGTPTARLLALIRTGGHDFDYEFQMTGMNARLNPDVETMFLMASESNQFISSRLVKEICSLGGDIGQFVSPRVMTLMAAKYNA